MGAVEYKVGNIQKENDRKKTVGIQTSVIMKRVDETKDRKGRQELR